MAELEQLRRIPKGSIEKCPLFQIPSKVTERIIREFTTPNRVDTFLLTAKTIISNNTTNLIETGCWRGTWADGCSTLVLAAIAREVGGVLDSYELSRSNVQIALNVLKQHGLESYVNFHVGDSVANLARRTKPVGFAYLDSYDCGMKSHRPSQEHQLAELEAIFPLLTKRAAILLDDNMEARGGKTKLSVRRLYARGWENLAYQWQILFNCLDTTVVPKSRFAVICGHLESFVPLAVETIYKNKAVYCVEHGYDLQVVRGVREKFVNKDSHANGFSWSRMEAMLDLVKSKRYEWVWCVGGDTLVTNMTTTLESIVDDVPDNKHLVICPEAVAPVQADSFLVRCSPEGMGYLRDILAQYPTYKTNTWVENQTMIDRAPLHAKITQIMPQHRLNSYQYDLYFSYEKYRHLYEIGLDANGHRGEWAPGDFLVHWPATSHEQRLQLIEKYRPKVIQPHLKIMLIYLAYTHIVGKGSENAPPPEYYHTGAERFLKTYLEFRPNQPHQLVVINCNIGKTNGMFNGVASHFVNYNGWGWDCGAWQHVAASVDCDFVICFNAWTHFWKKDWLEPFIKAFREFGAGLYSPTASYEQSPHLRTPCIAFNPGLIMEYPCIVNNRMAACEAEASPKSFTQWAISKQYPVKLVTEAGCYDWADWRKPANIFRRGDQSNVLIKDRHTLLYDQATPEEKLKLEAAADTLKA